MPRNTVNLIRPQLSTSLTVRALAPVAATDVMTAVMIIDLDVALSIKLALITMINLNNITVTAKERVTLNKTEIGSNIQRAKRLTSAPLLLSSMVRIYPLGKLLLYD